MGVNMKSIIKCALLSLIVTFVFILILACLSYFTDISESVITIGVYAAMALGVILGSVAVSRGAEHKVLIHAIILCVIYAVILVCVSLIINGGIQLNLHTAVVIAGIFMAGLLGCRLGK